MGAPPVPGSGGARGARGATDMALRRALLAAVAVAAALLLLLASLPHCDITPYRRPLPSGAHLPAPAMAVLQPAKPPAPARPPAPPAPRQPEPQPPSGAAVKQPDAKPAPVSATSSDQPASELSNPTAVSISSKPAQSSSTGPRPVLTGSMYESGHQHPHPELCPSLGARLRLLILVSSAPSHSTARDAVRLTWGSFARRSDVAMGFVLGRPPDSLKDQLAAEDALYGDLIIGNSVDSYSNLTLKTISMLEWTDAYCPRAPRLLKTDDDMFINVPKLLAWGAAPHRLNATKTVWGKVVHKSLPKRTVSSKYYLPPFQFPARVLPDFATGPAYLLTADCIQPLLRAAPNQPYVRLEDVFVTGVLASKVGIKRQHAPEFYNKKMSPHPCTVQRGIAIHMVRYHEQFDLWRKLLDGRTHCS